MPAPRQSLDAPAVDLHPPQLEAAIDRCREDQPAAVRHPVQPRFAAAEQVAVHRGRGLQVGPRDEVLRVSVPHPEAPDGCLLDLAALPVSIADGRQPSAVGRPCRSSPGLVSAPGRELAHPLPCELDQVDVGAPTEVGVAMTVRHECDPLPVRRPARVAVVMVAAGERLGIPGDRVDEPQPLEPVMDEASAVELVGERVDQPRVGRRRVLGTALGLLLGLRRARAAHHAQASAVRRPREPRHVLRQVGQLTRFPAVGEWQEPDLRSALLRRLRRPRLGAATTGLQHRATVRQESERSAVRTPARGRVCLRSDGQLPGWSRAIGRGDPERRPVAVLARRYRLDRERHLAAVGRDVELDRDAEVVEVLGARRASSHRANDLLASWWGRTASLSRVRRAHPGSCRGGSDRRPVRTTTNATEAIPLDVDF